MTTVLVFLVLLVFIMLDLPIVVAIGLTAVSFFVGQGQGQFLALLPQRMHAGTTGFTLLAVPFFILAGNLMNTGGVTNRIFRFAKAFVGHIPGGLGHVSVVAEMLFSGISGSAVADAAGLGQVSYKAMTDNGYKKPVAAAIVAASATLGPIIPPSISFVLYGALTSVSVPRLFLAGFLPGALMGGAIMIAIALMAKPRGFPRYPRATAKELWIATKESFLSLLSIVIILGGIFTGIFTPTEAAVIACLYALFLGFLYKELKLKDLPEMFWVSIKQSVALLFIMAAANFFGWFIIYQKIPDNIIATLSGMSASGPGVMAMFIVIIIILGLFLEGNAIFLITIPIFIPIAVQYGFDLVNFGVVMTLLIMIGNLTPPVGMCLYAVSSFTKIKIGELSKEALPYLIGIFIVTIIIAYVPAISTCLPNLLMGVAK
ncbi:Sialic acid TRAP transporter permease protein SiaT [bioreactor metagenome]|jgi:tripartite ATP-independent transporter DctM subunit|uniref:Sialic acid TRAP transporter permease protein SiaT n=1 Tax=bioreactor metagenome TaxID=1076179 RepID=A0A644T0L8_9ZZZZ|nr:TRAP transporter large permease [Spirochaetia bacterium]NLX46125.1 TRAP transporter large permease [Treponema sp.]HOI23121.1 TRAP transporter large permease [Spirochaetales bacterium]